ncbi:hypothetical protein D3C72_1837720 [compost metagenome]
MENSLGLNCPQDAPGLLLADVRFVSGLQDYCGIEIYDQQRRMVLDTHFSCPTGPQREQTADRR